MFDPTVHENSALAQHETVDRCQAVFIGGRKQRGDFITQRGGKPFIGVEMEQPIGFYRQSVLRPVALRRIILKRMADDLRAGRRGDFQGSIAAA